MGRPASMTTTDRATPARSVSPREGSPPWTPTATSPRPPARRPKPPTSDRNGSARVDDNNGQGYTGQECVTKGGIPALDANGNFAPTASQAAKAPDFRSEWVGPRR